MAVFYTQLATSPAWADLCDKIIDESRKELAEVVEELASKGASAAEEAVKASEKYRIETELIQHMKIYVSNNTDQRALRKETK